MRRVQKLSFKKNECSEKSVILIFLVICTKKQASEATNKRKKNSSKDSFGAFFHSNIFQTEATKLTFETNISLFLDHKKILNHFKFPRSAFIFKHVEKQAENIKN